MNNEPGEVRDGRYVIPSDDDHYGPTVVTAVKPRKRDFWRVLSGRYAPLVESRRTLTVKGISRTLKEVWSAKALNEAFNAPSPLLTLTEHDDDTEAS